MSRIDDLLRTLVAEGGSDLHLSSGVPSMMRRAGDLEELPGAEGAPGADWLRDAIAEVMPEREGREFGERFSLDFAYAIPDLARFRVNAFLHHGGVGAAFRVIPNRVPEFAELGLPAAVKDFARLSRGLVLVTGPKGAGKSTTLAALLQEMARSRALHILTLEDPVEFVVPAGRSIVQQRQVGHSVGSIASGIREALREDPDVLMISDLRGAEIFESALEAAEAGVLVLGALPTASARKTITRVVAAFPREERVRILGMMADSLRGVVGQILMNRADGEGRVLGLELMVVNDPISQLIREERIHQIPALIQTGRKAGSRLLDQHIMDLLMAGVIRAEEAHRWARQKEVFSAYLESTSTASPG